MLNSILIISRRFKSFITTPIFYVNADPHLGHLYSAVIADAAHRWALIKSNHRMSDYVTEFIFSTGTDEHGIKVQSAAEKSGRPLNEYCTHYSENFRRLFEQFDISYTDFIRTSEDRHKKAVEKFWRRLMKRGFIEKGTYEGWYSTIDECFYTKKDVETVDEDGVETRIAKETKSPVSWVKEENYVFDLSPFMDKLRQWLISSDVMQPSKYLPMTLQFLDDKDLRLSVSRDSKRLPWGIPVPDDPTQTIYVWFDALINYLTVTGFPDYESMLWPPDVQIIGKDIIKFHAIYLPCLLLAAELPLPKKIFVHGHWTVNGVKMSKSRGNVIDPIQTAQSLTEDGLRYFLLKMSTPIEDSNFTLLKAVNVINSDLAHNLGNLLSRATVAKLNPTQRYPLEFEMDSLEDDLRIIGEQLKKNLDVLPEKVNHFYDSLLFYKGLELIAETSKLTNLFFQHSLIWKKEPSVNTSTCLYLTYEAIRLCSLLLQPIVPKYSSKVLSRLGIAKSERCVNSMKFIKPEEMKGRSFGKDNGVVLEKIQLKDV